MDTPISYIPEMLYYNKSPIHGYGVFAKRELQINECLGVFTGEKMNRKWIGFDKYHFPVYLFQ